MAKKPLLEVRGMKWSEHRRFEKETTPLTKDLEGSESDAIVAEWIFKNIYPDVNIDDFTYGEVIAVAYRTLGLSGEIRLDEIKNLKLSSLGNGSVENTAAIAEESTNTEKKNCPVTNVSMLHQIFCLAIGRFWMYGVL